VLCSMRSTVSVAVGLLSLFRERVIRTCGGKRSRQTQTQGYVLQAEAKRIEEIRDAWRHYTDLRSKTCCCMCTVREHICLWPVGIIIRPRLCKSDIRNLKYLSVRLCSVTELQTERVRTYYHGPHLAHPLLGVCALLLLPAVSIEETPSRIRTA